MKVEQNERCANRRRSRPFRRSGTIPGGMDMSDVRFARSDIERWPLFTYLDLPRSPAIS